jgi:hypothetical protein
MEFDSEVDDLVYETISINLNSYKFEMLFSKWYINSCFRWYEVSARIRIGSDADNDVM